MQARKPAPIFIISFQLSEWNEGIYAPRRELGISIKFLFSVSNAER